MGNTTSAWSDTLQSIPVYAAFSEEAQAILARYVTERSTQQRSYRLKEFLAAIDWLPVDTIHPNPLKQLSRQEARVIRQEIERYVIAKKTKRFEKREKRQSYRLRVFDYYRQHISVEDKALLESLRDYELERIGQDINWRHYFWFTSFKQIDRFVAMAPQARQQVFAQFKHDVESHRKNAQRWQQQAWDDDCGCPDDVDMSQKQSSRHHNAGLSRKATPMDTAYQTLGLSFGAPFSQVRSRFRQLTLQVHPDMPEGSVARMKEVLQAYELLKTIEDKKQGVCS